MMGSWHERDRIYPKHPVLLQDLPSIYGPPMRYMPEACNSSWHRPAAGRGADATIVMAGNIRTRALLNQRLFGAGLPVRLYGAPVADWVRTPELAAAHTGEYLARAENLDVFRRARGVANSPPSAEYAGVKCRLFGACGSGGLVLTELRSGVTDLFEPGRELYGFISSKGSGRSSSGTWPIPSTDRRSRIKRAKLARFDHTYEHRFAAILEGLV